MEQIDWSKVKVGDECILNLVGVECTIDNFLGDAVHVTFHSGAIEGNECSLFKSRLTPETFRVIPQPKFKAGDFVRGVGSGSLIEVVCCAVNYDGSCSFFGKDRQGRHCGYAADMFELVEAAK